MAMITWHGFDIVCGMHSHHLSIDAYAILPVRIKRLGQLHERQRWCYIGIEVVFEGVGALVDIEMISRLHFDEIVGIVTEIIQYYIKGLPIKGQSVGEGGKR